jgi:hypothetical protein
MSNLPQLYEHLRDLGEPSWAHPFSYAAEEQVFYLGRAAVAVTDFDPDMVMIQTTDLSLEGIPVDEIAKHPALITPVGSIVGGPLIHERARKLLENPDDVLRVMQQAYAAVSPTIDLLTDLRGMSHNDYLAAVNEHGTIELQVQGDCACMFANLDGVYVRDRSEFGFSEYALHNTDTQAERTSLYAGFGHLARLAADI